MKVNTLSIDGLRGCAAMQVALGHIFMMSPLGMDLIGGNAMPLFFLVSGFVMVLGYGQKKFSSSGSMTMMGNTCCFGFDKMYCFGVPDPSYSVEGKEFGVYSFFVKRFARLGPMYYLTNLIALPLALGSSSGPLFIVTTVLLTFFLTSWGVVGIEPFNGVTWTISTMAFFYFCFPMLVVRLQNLQTIQEFKMLVWKMYGLQLSLFAVMSLIPGFEMGYDIWRVFPPCRLPVFVMGCCLAHIRLITLSQRTNTGTHTSSSSSSSSVTCATETEGQFLEAGTRTETGTEGEPEGEKGKKDLSSSPYPSPSLLFRESDTTSPALLYVAIMIVGMIFSATGNDEFAWQMRMFCEPLIPVLLFDWIMSLTQHQRPTPSASDSSEMLDFPPLTCVEWFLHTRPIQFLGHISMSFYMIHEVVLIYLTEAIIGNNEDNDDDVDAGDDEESSTHMNLKSWTVVMSVIVVSVLLGWLLTDYVESPMQQLVLKTLLPKQETAAKGSGSGSGSGSNSGGEGRDDSLETLMTQEEREDCDETESNPSTSSTCKLTTTGNNSSSVTPLSMA